MAALTGLYRDTERRWLAGVCAGIADYLGTPPALVRALAVLGLVFFGVPTLIAYLVLGVALRPRPARLFQNPAEEGFWRDMRISPADTLASLRHTFRDLEYRLQRAEALVTSQEFELRRGLRDIGA
jgi:phage shock protein C